MLNDTNMSAREGAVKPAAPPGWCIRIDLCFVELSYGYFQLVTVQGVPYPGVGCFLLHFGGAPVVLSDSERSCEARVLQSQSQRRNQQ